MYGIKTFSPYTAAITKLWPFSNVKPMKAIHFWKAWYNKNKIISSFYGGISILKKSHAFQYILYGQKF